MNRTITLGIFSFLLFLGVSLAMNDQEATAERNCLGCYGGDSCYGCYGCAGCFGNCSGCFGSTENCGCSGCFGAAPVCHGGYRHVRSGYRVHGWRGAFGSYSCHARPVCHGQVSCVGYAPDCSGTANYGAGWVLADECQPVQADPPTAAQWETTPIPPANDSAVRGRAIMAVRLPADAKLYENDRPTQNTGVVRRYEATGLRAGTNYRYVMRAEVVRDGRTLSQEKVILVRAGEQAELAFDFADEQTATMATARTQ